MRILAILLVLVGCTTARGAVPDKVNYVIKFNAPGDTALVIGAWRGSRAGTFPILHYQTRITQNETAIIIADSTGPAARIDTLLVALPTFGDTLQGLRFEVQALDSARNASGWGRSSTFFLARPFLPPSVPDSVSVDTTVVEAMIDGLRIEPKVTRIMQGFGTLVMSAVYLSGTDVVACATRLFVEVEGGIAIIPGGVCQIPIVRVDSVVFSDGSKQTPEVAAAGIQWSLLLPSPPVPSGRRS